MLRLVKLAKVMRSSKMFAALADRLESVVVISFATKTLVWWTVLSTPRDGPSHPPCTMPCDSL